MISEKSIASLKNFDLIIFGANGDLAYRKIFPALYHRLEEGQVKPKSRIAAMLRNTKNNQEYLSTLTKSLRKQIKGIDEKILATLIGKVDVISALTINGKYADLESWLKKSPNKVRVYYLATPSSVFGQIAKDLQDTSLITEESRIVLEKPLGKDGASSALINNSILKYFDEKQIYRIDHYLGKETVQNLMVLRFANYIFENLWNANHIENVQITAAEKLGIEKRGEYYDNYGALLDMVQNHLLQLLCLIAMEPPSCFKNYSYKNFNTSYFKCSTT